MYQNNKSNIVYYPTTPQTIYVQAVPIQVYNTNPPPYNPYYGEPNINHNISNNPVPTNVIETVAPKSLFKPPSMWQTGMLDCFSDCGICCCGCLCPCCLHGMNVKKLNNGNCLCHSILYVLCCGPLQQCKLRKQLRKRYNLQQSPCNDCCVAFCCGPCGLCQEAREIKYQKLVNTDGPIVQNMN